MKIREIAKPRRIVTGMAPDGSSRIVRVDDLEVVRRGAIGGVGMASLVPGFGIGPSAPRGGYYRTWATDQLPISLPTSGLTAPVHVPHLPDETDEVLRRAAAVGPELGMRAAWVDYADLGAPTEMHWHDSVDIRFVMAGARGQITDDGEEFVWQTGDVLIQNATNHAHWQFGEESAIIGTVVVGGLRVGDHPPVGHLHPVQRGPIGGHRLGESRQRIENLHLEPPWTTDCPPPGKLKRTAETITSFDQVERPRRIVTGMNDRGFTAAARSETALEIDYANALLPAPGPENPLAAYWPIWGADRLPEMLPTDGLAPPFHSEPSDDEAVEALRRSQVLPPPLGYRVGVAKLVSTVEPGPMSWHDSMEIIFVMDGEVDILHDDGSRFTITVGDTLVQNGTNHAWHVRGEQPAWLGIVSFGAIRFGATPPVERISALQRGDRGNRPAEGARFVEGKHR